MHTQDVMYKPLYSYMHMQRGSTGYHMAVSLVLTANYLLQSSWPLLHVMLKHVEANGSTTA